MNSIDKTNMIHYMVYLHNPTMENGYVRVIVSTEISEKKNETNSK